MIMRLTQTLRVVRDGSRATTTLFGGSKAICEDVVLPDYVLPDNDPR